MNACCSDSSPIASSNKRKNSSSDNPASKTKRRASVGKTAAVIRGSGRGKRQAQIPVDQDGKLLEKSTKNPAFQNMLQPNETTMKWLQHLLKDILDASKNRETSADVITSRLEILANGQTDHNKNLPLLVSQNIDINIDMDSDDDEYSG